MSKKTFRTTLEHANLSTSRETRGSMGSQRVVRVSPKGLQDKLENSEKCQSLTTTQQLNPASVQKSQRRFKESFKVSPECL